MRYTPKDRGDWRRWLARNHDSAGEVWLVFYKATARKRNLSYDDAVEEALCFGWVDGIKKSVDEQRYMHRFSPRKSASKWSASNRKRAERRVEAGLMQEAGLKTVAEAKANGNWDNPVKPAGPLPMPEEFEAALGANPRAARFLESLPPSARRQYVDWVASAKREDTRQRRLAEALDLLSKGKRLGMR